MRSSPAPRSRQQQAAARSSPGRPVPRRRCSPGRRGTTSGCHASTRRPRRRASRGRATRHGLRATRRGRRASRRARRRARRASRRRARRRVARPRARARHRGRAHARARRRGRAPCRGPRRRGRPPRFSPPRAGPPASPLRRARGPGCRGRGHGRRRRRRGCRGLGHRRRGLERRRLAAAAAGRRPGCRHRPPPRAGPGWAVSSASVVRMLTWASSDWAMPSVLVGRGWLGSWAMTPVMPRRARASVLEMCIAVAKRVWVGK